MLFSIIPQTLAGLPVTLQIAFLSMICAIFLASVLYLLRQLKAPVLTQLVEIYLLIIRSIPLLVQLYIVCYGIPSIIRTIELSRGIEMGMSRLSNITLVVIAFSVSASASVFYNIQSALSTVGKSQIEAAYAIGMTPPQAFVRVIFPQAFSALIRPMGNTFVTVLKSTSLAFLVSCVDLMGAAKIAGMPGFRFMEVYILTALIYWGLSLLFGKGISLLENRTRRHGKGEPASSC